MKYKKIIFLIMGFYMPYILLAGETNDKTNNDKTNPAKLLADLEKKLFLGVCASFSSTYKETVAVAALHFIVRDNKEALELKLIKKVGGCFYKIIIEIGDYGKALFFLPVPVVEKGKRLGVILASVCCMHFIVKTLSNRQ